MSAHQDEQTAREIAAVIVSDIKAEFGPGPYYADEHLEKIREILIRSAASFGVSPNASVEIDPRTSIVKITVKR